jgi:predicted negative regulator of RcsB-dependent stress response
MDEETAIINSNTRNEKIRNFFVNNKKSLLISVIIIIGILIGYFAYAEYKEE